MTTDFQLVADMAELAEASYANLINSNSAESLKLALISTDPNFLGDKPFSETQATDFVQH
jgi:hypothetical protein